MAPAHASHCGLLSAEARRAPAPATHGHRAEPQAAGSGQLADSRRITCPRRGQTLDIDTKPSSRSLQIAKPSDETRDLKGRGDRAHCLHTTVRDTCTRLRMMQRNVVHSFMINMIRKVRGAYVGLTVLPGRHSAFLRTPPAGTTMCLPCCSPVAPPSSLVHAVARACPLASRVACRAHVAASESAITRATMQPFTPAHTHTHTRRTGQTRTECSDSDSKNTPHDFVQVADVC